MARSAPRRASRPQPAPPAPAWTSLAAGAALLLVYLAWLPPVPGDGDSSELTVVLATLGLAHPTGYPLYTILGHFFVLALHALGAGWAAAANAWSALGGAVAMGLLHAVAARLLRRAGVRPASAALVALLPVLALGLNPAWSAEATLAEVNSWHIAWVAGACLLALTTLDDLPRHRSDAAWVRRRALAWGVVLGVGIAHHVTSVLVALPLSVALLAAARPWRLSWLAPALAGALVPLAGWSYVLYRSIHPAAVQWGSLGPGLHETWNHVTAAGYRHYLGGFAPTPDQRTELTSYVLPWLAPGLVAALLWPFARVDRPRATRLALAAAALLPAAWALSYGVGDPVPYFLPSLAIGLAVLPAAAATLGIVRRLARPLAIAAGLAVLAAGWTWNRTALERRAELGQLDRFLHTMWEAVPLRRGYVLWDEDMSARLVQYQQLEGARPELVVVRPLLLMDAGARRLFAAHHGFDPLGGASPPSDAEAERPGAAAAFADAIAQGINRSTPDSVILFLPREPSLRLLPKP